MVVSELFAKLGLAVDEASFRKGEVVLGGLRTALGALGLSVGAAASGIAAMVVKTSQAGDAAVKASARLGITTDAVQELGYAAGLSGSSFEELEGGLARLARTTTAAVGGSKEAKKAFDSVGVSATDGAGKARPLDELLGDLADKFAGMEDGTKKAALAQEFFGRGGARLIPLLNEGREGLSALRQEARALGIVLDSETSAASVEFADNLDRAKAGVRGLTYAIAGQLIKHFDEATKRFVEWVKANREWIAERVHEAIELFSNAWKIATGLLSPFLKLLLAIVTNTTALRIALTIAAGILAAQFGKSVADATRGALKFLGAIRSITLAQVGSAAAAIATGLAWAAAFALVLALIEEIYGWVTGDRETLLERAFGPYADMRKRFTVLQDVEDAFNRIRFAIENAGEAWKGFKVALGMADEGILDPNSGLAKAARSSVSRMNEPAFKYNAQIPKDFDLSKNEEWLRDIEALSYTKSGFTNSDFLRKWGPGGTHRDAAGIPQAIEVKFGDINVTAPAGSDPDEFAKKVREQVGDVVDEKLRGILDPAYEAVQR